MFSKKTKNIIKSLIPKRKVDKVSLFVVGAQKSGTSALHVYLNKHPNIQDGKKKEINFFNHREKFSKGVRWYHKQFSPVLFYKPKPFYIDSTPKYLNDKSVAEKIYNYNSNAKIVIVLREPVSRAYSAWNMYRKFSELSEDKKEKLIESHVSFDNINEFRDLINLNPFPSFDSFIAREINNASSGGVYPNIVSRGIYADQVKGYIDLFGEENVLIFESNYFKKNKIEVTNRVLESIGLPPLKLAEAQFKLVHSISYENQIDEATKMKLSDYYKPHNERLFNLINKKFDW